MRFRSYPRVERQAPLLSGAWVATEKIHGANFVAAAAAGAIAFGKRKAWITPDDMFFGYQLVAPMIADAVLQIARTVDAPQLVCYGELFGGHYPHPDVPPTPGLSPIQTGVWYSPDLHYAVFDILVATSDDDDGELLAAADTEQLAGEAGLPVPPVLGRGRRDELERIAVSAPTAVPALFGLPPIADNRREGYVLKPARRAPVHERAMLKHKLPDFDDARFDEAAAWNPERLALPQLLDWAARLVNPARLASARSKVGTSPDAILDEVVLDVLIDLERVFATTMRTLAPADEAALAAAIRTRAAASG